MPVVDAQGDHPGHGLLRDAVADQGTDGQPVLDVYRIALGLIPDGDGADPGTGAADEARPAQPEPEPGPRLHPDAQTRPISGGSPV